MKTTLIAVAAAVAAVVTATAALTLAPAASPARAASNATILAAEGNALFKARGTPPWYYSSRTFRSTVSCIEETRSSYYCTVGLRSPAGQRGGVLSMYFVHVSGGLATWNAISAASIGESSDGGGGGGPFWTSAVVAVTNAP